MTSPPATQTVVCKLVEENDLPAWDRFVEQHAGASIYHLSVWRDILASAFGKRWYAVAAWQDGAICAGIPLVHMQSRLFGNFLVSMPYFNYGGLLTTQDALAEPVLQHVATFAQHLGVQHVELRHLAQVYPQLPARQDKVSMWLPLPETAQQLWESFKAKLRSQVRKGEKNGLQVRVGGAELLADFYTVFAQNMRDLGTPVYSRAFFRIILQHFSESARLVVVRDTQDQPIAAGFLLGYRQRLEIPWASSLRAYNHLQANMWLYWQCLQYACDQRYRTFDFGRSTVGESTYKFKEQWGAQPVQHYWHYQLAAGQTIPQLNPHNPKFRLAIQLWQKLPLRVTYVLGPAIVKHLP